MKTLFNYFLRGLLIVFPLVVTVYLLVAGVRWFNTTFNDLLFEWLSVDIPGLGIVTVFLSVALLGYLFSLALIRPLVNYFEQLLVKVPFVKIIYSSIKELTEAFVGDKKRFNKPVLVQFGTAEIKRIGFITQQDLTNLGLEESVSVYCPHSYNFSGNLYILPKENVTPLKIDAADAMKYVVSGGVTNLSSSKN